MGGKKQSLFSDMIVYIEQIIGFLYVNNKQ